MSNIKKIIASNMLKRNLVASLLLIILMAASITGATYAWFTSSSTVIQNAFTAGTVELSEPVIESQSSTVKEDLDRKCEIIEWKFSNTGTKSTYVRVRPDAKATGEKIEFDDETAWVGVDGDDPDFKTIDSGQDWNQYYEYDLSQFADGDELNLDILASSEFKDVGDATTKVYEDTLYIDLETTGGWEMAEVHIYAGLEKPTNHSPGQLGWGFENLTGAERTHFPFATDKINEKFAPPNKNPEQLVSELDGTETIYIVVHLDVVKETTGSNGGTIALDVDIDLCSGQEDDWQEDGGWWYYGNSNGPYVVNIDSPEVVVCFKYCAIAQDGYKIKSMEAYLEAEAVQASNYAIDLVWKDEHPWYPLKETE